MLFRPRCALRAITLAKPLSHPTCLAGLEGNNINCPHLSLSSWEPYLELQSTDYLYPQRQLGGCHCAEACEWAWLFKLMYKPVRKSFKQSR